MPRQHKNRPKGESAQVRINVPNFDAYKDWCKAEGAQYCFMSMTVRFNLWLASLIKKSG